MVTRIQRAKFNEIKNWLRVQPDPAKKAYNTAVREIVVAYVSAVDPMRIHCHRVESDTSQFSRQVSVQECAKSTSRTRPRRMKIVAPSRAI